MHSLRILALSPLLFTATCASKPSNAVLLSDIQTLTLRNNRKTSARRVSARDQLSCIGGTAKGLFAIDVMRCKNSGSEYDTADVQWTCTASLPPEFRLGSTDVNCEGFDSPDDPYVLKGSCAVDYRLMLTAAGEARYGLREEPVSHKPTVVKNLLFYLVVAFILAVMAKGVWDNCQGQPRRPRQPPHGGHDGYGGQDDGHDDDPPPPYSQKPPSTKPKTTSTRSPKPRGASSISGPSAAGLAAGAAMGAAAGYYAGSRREDPQVGRSSLRNSPQQGRSTYDDAASSSSSTSRYESTGFGGTTRR